MRFGLFGGVSVPRGDPPAVSATRLADYIETNVEAEALGYYATFLTEHHFTGVGQISAPLQVLTAIAMRTTKLRLGTAVMVLAWHNPAMLAEQAATLDLISSGRLELGIGKGYRASEFSGFAVPMEEAEGRFDEAFAVLKQAFTSTERFSHHGTYWHLDNVLVEPQPVQRPHPPLWIAAGNTRLDPQGCRTRLQPPARSVPVAGADQGAHCALSLGRGGARAYLRPANGGGCAQYLRGRRGGRSGGSARPQIAVHRRMVELSQRAGASNCSHILQYDTTPGSTEESALYGPAEEIVARLGRIARGGRCPGADQWRGSQAD